MKTEEITSAILIQQKLKNATYCIKRCNMWQKHAKHIFWEGQLWMWQGCSDSILKLGVLSIKKYSPKKGVIQWEYKKRVVKWWELDNFCKFFVIFHAKYKFGHTIWAFFFKEAFLKRIPIKDYQKNSCELFKKLFIKWEWNKTWGKSKLKKGGGQNWLSMAKTGWFDCFCLRSTDPPGYTSVQWGLVFQSPNFREYP